MPCYLVAYDLKRVGQNYTCITGKLEKLANCHAQGSVWFVDHPGPESALRSQLVSCLDQNDRLFVSEVSRAWASQNMSVCGKWLNERGY
jgi:hypothetical protein